MNIDDYINSELEIKDKLRKYLNPKDKLIIFDIGSCEGEDSIRYSNFFKNSKIFAFEPLSKNIQRIEENIKNYKKDNIILIKKALSDKVGESVFYISSGKPDNVKEGDTWDYGNKSSSLLKPDMVRETHPWLNFNEKIEVSTDTIENFCINNSIQQIDFIHLDVQGAELMVLKGAGHYLSRVKVIWMEVEKVRLYDRQPLKHDLEKFMKDHGFKKVFEKVNSISGDQLYVSKSFFNNTKLKRKVFEISSFFTSKLLNNLNNYKKVSFSQSGEDLIIDYIFFCRGIVKPSYLDIGAHHPFKFNNCAIFYQRGSRGINIEPDPLLFNSFLKERKKDINLNIGIGPQRDNLDFYLLSPSTLNTFSKNEANKYVKEHGFKIKEVIKVPVETISNILDKYFNSKFPDFLTLDVEGMEMDILKSIDFSYSRPKVICIESISYSDTGRGEKNLDCIKYLEARDFLVYADTNINTIFVDKDFWKI